MRDREHSKKAANNDTQTNEDSRTKREGVVTGNKLMGTEEHMANKDRVMCSNTTQTMRH